MLCLQSALSLVSDLISLFVVIQFKLIIATTASGPCLTLLSLLTCREERFVRLF